MSRRRQSRAATRSRGAAGGKGSGPAPTDAGRRRLVARIVGTVGFLGVVTGIAASVASLLPDDPPGRIAEVTLIDLQPMHLSEYEIRTARTGPRASGNAVLPLLLATGGIGPGATGATGESGATGEPEAADEPGGETVPEPSVTSEAGESPEPQGEPTSSPEAGDGTDDGESDSNQDDPDAHPGDASDGGDAEELGTAQEQLELPPAAAQATGEAMGRIEDAAPATNLGACGDDQGIAKCGLTPMLAQIVGPDGGTATAEEAAQEVVTLLRSTRMRRTPSGRREVLGVVVDFDVRLVGFGSGGGWIAWAIYRRDGEPLPTSWRREVTVLRIKPRGDGPEQVSGGFWVPLPRPEAAYKVRVSVYDADGVRRGQRATRPFPDRAAER